MPTNIDEVRRAFSGNGAAGTTDRTVTERDPTGRGDASNSNGTSVDGTPVTDGDIIDGNRTVSPTNAVAKPDTGKRARSNGNDRRTGNDTGKSRTRTATVTTRPETTTNLERLLFTIHTMLAAKTDIKSLNLPPTEARELATAFTELNALYGGKGGIIGPKTFAWINFTIALGGTYAPMMINARKEIRAKRELHDTTSTNISTGS